MKARYALGAQKTALDTESAAAALREESSTLLGLTNSVSHMAAELVDCGRAADALDAKVAALEMLPIVPVEVQGYARASSPALQLLARTPVDTHSHKRHLPHSPFFDEELGDDSEVSAVASTRRGPVAWHDEPLAGPAERLAHPSDRGGRKSVRFTAGAKADPAGSYETAASLVPPRETRKSLRAPPPPEIRPAMSVPRGSSPSSEPMHGRNAAADYHPAESMPPPRYGQALLAYTSVVGGGGSGDPAGLSKKLAAPRASIASERPHFGRGPMANSAASAPYHGGRVAGAPIGRLAVADDDSQSVASQGSLFGSKLVATRF